LRAFAPDCAAPLHSVVIRESLRRKCRHPATRSRAELVVDAILCWPSRSCWQLFQSIAGRNSQILHSGGCVSMASFFREAFRRLAGGILWLFPCPRTPSALSAKVLITKRVLINVLIMSSIKLEIVGLSPDGEGRWAQLAHARYHVGDPQGTFVFPVPRRQHLQKRIDDQQTTRE